jgi:hypothetical protein
MSEFCDRCRFDICPDCNECPNCGDCYCEEWAMESDAPIEEEGDTDETCPKCGEKGVPYGAHCHMVP